MTTDKQAPQRTPTATVDSPQKPPTSATTPAPPASPAPAPKPATRPTEKPSPPTARDGKVVAQEYGDAIVRKVTLMSDAPRVPQIEIINLQASPVHVMYTPVGQTKSISHKLPIGGARPGEYPPELLDAPHFKDLTMPPGKVLEVKEL